MLAHRRLEDLGPACYGTRCWRKRHAGGLGSRDTLNVGSSGRVRPVQRGHERVAPVRRFQRQDGAATLRPRGRARGTLVRPGCVAGPPGAVSRPGADSTHRAMLAPPGGVNGCVATSSPGPGDLDPVVVRADEHLRADQLMRHRVGGRAGPGRTVASLSTLRVRPSVNVGRSRGRWPFRAHRLVLGHGRRRCWVVRGAPVGDDVEVDVAGAC